MRCRIVHAQVPARISDVSIVLIRLKQREKTRLSLDSEIPQSGIMVVSVQ